MQAETIEQRNRAKAFALWEEDGSMEGCANEYWRKARVLVEAETAAVSDTNAPGLYF